MGNTRSGHVLVVDDEPLVVAGLSQYLKQQGYQVSTANSVTEALAEIEKHMPDLVLLDLCMPEVGGMDMLVELRQDPDTQSLPVIVTSALTGTEDIVSALRAGANDYITKPVNLPVLLARIERHLKISSSIMSLERQQQLNWQMAAADEVTGICNRRFLLQSLEAEIYRSKRHGNPLSILMIDLDNFHGLSQQHGAQASDLVLRQFVESVTGALRRSDKLCRFEGDEFCVILPQTDGPGAIKAADDIRRWLEQISFSADSSDVGVTACIGVATLQRDHEGGAEALVEQALTALKEAQKQGTNRICMQEGPAGCRLIDAAALSA